MTLEAGPKEEKNIKVLFEIQYKYLKEIQVEQLYLKHKLKSYKVMASNIHRKMNQID